jgi:drug/metabolite transporter (DMT)-like permease
MVAYLMPIFGIILGAAVADEAVTPRLLAGTVLVVGGIALVNASRAALPFRRKTLVIGPGRAA